MRDDVMTATGSWAPEYAERLHHLAHLGPMDGADLGPQAAAALAAFNAPFGEVPAYEVTVERREIPGQGGPIPVRVYRPVGGVVSGAVLVWFHGGAFLGGDLDMPEADHVAKAVAARFAAVVVSVDYRLCVDGVHHPAPHDDGYAAFRWTVAHADDLGVDPARVAVGGASAGACLAATVALHGRDDDAPPARVLLAYPTVHAVLPEPSDALRAALEVTPPLLRFPPDVVTVINTNYLGGPAEQGDPYAFPGHATDLTGFPPTYIENAEFDDLRASGEEFARQLAAAGVDVELATMRGVPHGHLNAVGSHLALATVDRFGGRLP